MALLFPESFARPDVDEPRQRYQVPFYCQSSSNIKGFVISCFRPQCQSISTRDLLQGVLNIDPVEGKLEGVSIHEYINYTDPTYSQQCCPNCVFEASYFGAACAHTFSEIDHDRPKILDVFQAFRYLIQRIVIIWSQEYADEVVTFSNHGYVHAGTKEILPKPVPPLMSMSKMVEHTI